MIKWNEAKKAIKHTLGEELKNIGFENPSYLMYRYRPNFIDIVLCYYNNFNSFYIELGCQPKGVKIKNNFKTWDSIFRGRVHLESQVLSIELQDTFEKQIISIRDLVPEILVYIIDWFNNFKDVSSAITALENIDTHVQAKSIIFARKGSPLYNEALKELKELKGKE